MTQKIYIKNGCVKMNAAFLLEDRKWMLDLQVADVKFKIVVPDPNDAQDNDVRLVAVRDPYKSSASLPAVRTRRKLRKKFEIVNPHNTTVLMKPM